MLRNRRCVGCFTANSCRRTGAERGRGRIIDQPEFLAAAVNTVWSWDITYLRAPVLSLTTDFDVITSFESLDAFGTYRGFEAKVARTGKWNGAARHGGSQP